MPADISAIISSSKASNCHFSGDSVTPSSVMNSAEFTFRMNDPSFLPGTASKSRCSYMVAQRASRRPEILRPKQSNDLGFAVADDCSEALAPFDRFFQRLGLNHGEAAHELLHLDKRAVGDGEFPARE